MSKKSVQTSDITPAPGTLVEQPHGGAIRRGNPGNKGGVGRAPSAIRATLRESFDERVRMLGEIADGVVTLKLRERCEHCGKEPTEENIVDVLRRAVDPADRLRAIDMMARYGFGPGMALDEVRANLKATIAMIKAEAPDQSERLIDELERIWLGDR